MCRDPAATHSYTAITRFRLVIIINAAMAEHVTLRFCFVDRATAKQFPSRHPLSSDGSSPSPMCKLAVPQI
jgi:hypothetical protein